MGERKTSLLSVVITDEGALMGIEGLREQVHRIHRQTEATHSISEEVVVLEDGSLQVRFLGAYGSPKGIVSYTLPPEKWKEKH